MAILRRVGPAGVVAGFAILLGTGLPTAAQDAASSSVSTKTIDQNLHRVLRDVINQGADLFNQGDQRACYYLYRGALITARSQLGHHPSVQKLIDEGLSRTNAENPMDRRAWGLRRLLDQVRDQINPNPGKPAEKKAAEGRPLEGAPLGPAEPSKKPEIKSAPLPRVLSLWERLGGEVGVTKVVDDFFTYVTEDKIDIARGGKIKFDDKKTADFKKNVVAFISSASGGPIPYKGKSMKEAHKGMGITNAEFDATAQALVKALKKNGVQQADIDELMTAVAATRKDIVEKK